MNKSNNIETPVKSNHSNSEAFKRFKRKPYEKSQRSKSKKSLDSSRISEGYIKTPIAKNNQEKKNPDDFFKNLASSILTTSSDRKHALSLKRLEQPNSVNCSMRVETLEAEMQLKNHEAGVLSNECEKYKNLYEQQKQKRRRNEKEKKQLLREIKELKNEGDKVKKQIRKQQKEKQYLVKQIQFLERINYDEKTKNLQSYRETYLQEEISKLKAELKKQKTTKQTELEDVINKIQEEKYTLQSNYKAMKVANECLLKQLSYNNKNITQLVLNSEQYTRLRQKYMKFLGEYKILRNDYWSLKSQINVNKNQSSVFSFTMSEASELTGLDTSFN